MTREERLEEALVSIQTLLQDEQLKCMIGQPADLNKAYTYKQICDYIDGVLLLKC